MLSSVGNSIEGHLASLRQDNSQLAEWVRENVRYDAPTGDPTDTEGLVLTRRPAKGRATVVLMGEKFSSASAVWFYHHGNFPPGSRFMRCNNDRSDDRIENLGILTADEKLAGAGDYWAVDLLGVFASYEAALAAYEARDLV